MPVETGIGVAVPAQQVRVVHAAGAVDIADHVAGQLIQAFEDFLVRQAGQVRLQVSVDRLGQRCDLAAVDQVAGYKSMPFPEYCGGRRDHLRGCAVDQVVGVGILVPPTACPHEVQKAWLIALRVVQKLAKEPEFLEIGQLVPAFGALLLPYFCQSGGAALLDEGYRIAEQCDGHIGPGHRATELNICADGRGQFAQGCRGLWLRGGRWIGT